MEKANPFIELKGEQLSSVIFVQNYLQLDFDGFRITFYEWPTLTREEKSFHITEVEYRNVLCSFIANIVKDVILIDDTIFSIIFDHDNNINLSLGNAKGEVIYFTTPNNEWLSI